MPTGVAVPAAFPGIRFSLSSLRVMPATTSPCGTIVALDSSDPRFREISPVPSGERASPACHGLDPPPPPKGCLKDRMGCRLRPLILVWTKTRRRLWSELHLWNGGLQGGTGMAQSVHSGGAAFPPHPSSLTKRRVPMLWGLCAAASAGAMVFVTPRCWCVDDRQGPAREEEAWPAVRPRAATRWPLSSCRLQVSVGAPCTHRVRAVATTPPILMAQHQ